MPTIHLAVHGRVQGVGFRMFVQTEAQRRGLDGWVRNLRDGSVEAVIAGNDAALEAMVAACRRGPPGSEVTTIDQTPWPDPVRSGFRIEPTV